MFELKGSPYAKSPHCTWVPYVSVHKYVGGRVYSICRHTYCYVNGNLCGCHLVNYYRIGHPPGDGTGVACTSDQTQAPDFGATPMFIRWTFWPLIFPSLLARVPRAHMILGRGNSLHCFDTKYKRYVVQF